MPTGKRNGCQVWPAVGCVVHTGAVAMGAPAAWRPDGVRIGVWALANMPTRCNRADNDGRDDVLLLAVHLVPCRANHQYQVGVSGTGKVESLVSLVS